MFQSTRQVLQAIISNGYEVRTDRKSRSDGTMVWLIKQSLNEEVFYFFTNKTEEQVVKAMAWQYCTFLQISEIFDDDPDYVMPQNGADPHFEFA